MGEDPQRVPAPAPPPDPGGLPRTLTFVLTADERASVLRVLRRYGPDRAAALTDALGIDRRRGPGGGTPRDGRTRAR